VNRGIVFLSWIVARGEKRVDLAEAELAAAAPAIAAPLPARSERRLIAVRFDETCRSLVIGVTFTISMARERKTRRNGTTSTWLAMARNMLQALYHRRAPVVQGLPHAHGDTLRRSWKPVPTNPIL